MKINNILTKLIFLIAFVPLTRLHADSVVFQIGEFDSQNGDFEHESDTYNNPSYYWEAGDYSATQGSYGFGALYEGLEAEILQDGPGGLVDPQDPESGQVWALSQEGFPRALVPGREVLDIFFQLSAAEAAAPALVFETKLYGLGANSYHDVTFYLNNVPFYRKLRVTGDTDLKLVIPKNLPGMVYNEGGNVLSARRTGGGKVDAAGEDNQWIQFDALKLTSLSAAPSTELLWQIGSFDNTPAEFEPEFGGYNNAQYYLQPGDYTTSRGKASQGGVFNEPGAEIWKDAEGAGDATIDGFPRALTNGRQVIDMYFKLTAAQAQKDYLLLKTILFQQGGNSSHDVIAYLNGTPVRIGLDIKGPTDVEALIPRRGVRGEGMGPEFIAGDNVLSFVRVSGGPVIPVSEGGTDEPYIQIDAVSLSTADAPANPADVDAYRSLFSVGYHDSNTAEFEQESGDYNNPFFYTAPGDYTAVAGKAGSGEVWEGPSEIWQDGPDGPLDPAVPAGPRKWSETRDGFPRALTNGWTATDVFFQAGESASEGLCLFTARLLGLGAGSSHDLEFFLNGQSFRTQTGVDRDTYITALIPAGVVVPGANVLSLVRTGGLDVAPWIQFDQVELISEAGAYVAPAAEFDIAAVSRAANGAVTLTWESVEGAVYTVWSSDTMQGAWTPLVTGMAAAAGATTTSHTDATLPANTTRRFYRVERTQ